MKQRYDDIDEYIADLKMEIAANEQCANHHYNLGLALLSKRDFVGAEEDPVCLAHLDLPQHKARCCHLHIRPPVLCFVDFCTSDSRKCCLSAQSAASRPPFCPCRSPPWLQCSRGGAGMLAEWGIK